MHASDVQDALAEIGVQLDLPETYEAVATKLRLAAFAEAIERVQRMRDEAASVYAEVLDVLRSLAQGGDDA